MKTFLATWIVIQLVVIGFAGRSIWNEVADKTYDCNQTMTHAPIIIVDFPLVYFVQPFDFVEEYCR